MSSLLDTFNFPASGSSDPYYSNVSLLLHCDGTNGSTSFPDNSPSPKTVTASGNAQVTTANYKFGTGSLLLDGNGDYISAPSNAGFDFGTGDFTVECFIRFTSFPAASGSIVGTYPGSWVFQYRPDAGNKLAWYDGGFNYSAALSLSLNTQYYVAVTRSGTSLKFWVDGVQSGSTITNSTNLSSSGALTVGMLAGIGQEVNGCIDEIRLTKGVARDVSTVPTAPFSNS